jgi:hypothetical protein
VPNNTSLQGDISTLGLLRLGDIMYFSYYVSLQQFTVTVTNISTAFLYLRKGGGDNLADFGPSDANFVFSGASLSQGITINACDYGGDISGIWYFAVLNAGLRSFFQIRASSQSKLGVFRRYSDLI